jgi:hypothetical protein
MVDLPNRDFKVHADIGNDAIMMRKNIFLTTFNGLLMDESTRSPYRSNYG